MEKNYHIWWLNNILVVVFYYYPFLEMWVLFNCNQFMSYFGTFIGVFLGGTCMRLFTFTYAIIWGHTTSQTFTLQAQSKWMKYLVWFEQTWNLTHFKSSWIHHERNLNRMYYFLHGYSCKSPWPLIEMTMFWTSCFQITTS
jgi:hypothetical protein